MTDEIKEAVRKRDDAMRDVRIWWDRQRLLGNECRHDEAPAWQEYLAAFATLDALLTEKH